MKTWSEHQKNCLKAMNLVIWQNKLDVQYEITSEQGFNKASNSTKNQNTTLDSIGNAIELCAECFTEGNKIAQKNINSEILVLVENISDLEGEANVLLEKMLSAINLKKDGLYVLTYEICQYHLKKIISLLNTKLIISFSNNNKLNDINILQINTYSLNSVLQNTSYKREVWEQLKKAKTIIDQNGLT